ncbi:MAG: 50S ribosomal protein L31 [Patescibacteria group bacterium]
MKAKIHPKYFSDVQVTCSCGNKFVTGSTVQIISVDICSKCHPLYTGEHRFIDTKGKVEKFQKKQKLAAEMQAKLGDSKGKRKEKAERQSKSLRELLAES